MPTVTVILLGVPAQLRVGAINDALRELEKARDGSFEEYGRALDRLDRAVENYQSQN